MEVVDAAALFEQALAIVHTDEDLFDIEHVLRLSGSSGCSGYDCEYVALAEMLQVALVTADTKIVKSFPSRATLLYGQQESGTAR
jgi:predicted nucleic acid-binding protein